MQNQHLKILANWLIYNLERNAVADTRADGKFLLQTEKRLSKKTKTIFDKQLNWVLGKLKSIPELSQLKLKGNSLEDEIEDLVDDLPFKKELTNSIVASMSVGMDRGGKTIVKKLKLGKFGVVWSLKNKEAIKFLKDKRTLELSNKKGNIDDTTKTRITEIIYQAAKSGQSYQKTAKLIAEQGQAGVFSQARSQLIATRETRLAYEVGNRIPIDDFQTKYPDREILKRWSTVNDDNVTDECQANQDEGWIGLDEPFDSGDEIAPRYGNPRCRCAIEYKILPPK